MLDRKTLVLNRSWMPVTTTTVRRAVVLMARGVAGAVHPGTFEVAQWEAWIERGPDDVHRLRAIGFEFPVPDVIVLTHYNGFPDLPVVDLIVERNELVIASHGRSFWILDNMAPLREYGADLARSIPYGPGSPTLPGQSRSATH